MNKKPLIISIVAVLISFAGGFFIANALNRSQIEALQTEVGNLKASSAQNPGEPSLSDEEIRRKISEADQNPLNIDFQKNLAFALYRYASLKQKPELLDDVARLLARVYEKNPKDFNLTVSLANLHFDIAQNKKTDEEFQKARDFYRKALELNAEDAETRADYGLTFLMTAKPEPQKAVAEFEKALKIAPENEKILQNMVQAQAGAENFELAEKYLVKLKQINPNNNALSELETLIAERKAKAQK